ncbi:hypothetical protein ACFE04_000400 [Oxalis oulophora]
MIVLIADDRWVVGTSNGKVCVNPIVRQILERVCELLQGPGRVWNDDIIKKGFSKAHGDLIHAMPICDGHVADQFVRSGNLKGVYSVKYEYYVAHDYLFNSAVSLDLAVFSIIKASTMEHKHLVLPQSFPEKFIPEMDSHVSLQTPAHRSWMVSVDKRINGMISLYGPAWEHFAEHHDFAFGHLLFFQCHSPVKFIVVIFDQSACEIEYPIDHVVLEDACDSIVVKTIRKGEQPLIDHVVDSNTNSFYKKMTPSDVRRNQILASVAGNDPVESRLIWNFREGRCEGSICSPGWNSLVKNLNLSPGDIVKFDFGLQDDKMPIFNIHIVNKCSTVDGGGKFQSILCHWCKCIDVLECTEHPNVLICLQSLLFFVLRLETTYMIYRFILDDVKPSLTTTGETIRHQLPSKMTSVAK